jgi:hypothetical protein
MGSSDLIFIVGRQRSGTTVLRDLMARYGAIDCDEIFHGHLARESRFYSYVLERVNKEPHLVHPEHHAGLFYDYIKELRQKAEGRKLAMDVKYFGLNLIPKREDVDAREPFIINFMSNSKANVVNIIRRNKLRVYVSEEMSKRTGRWSAGHIEHLPTDKPKLDINVDEALQFIERLLTQDERVEAMMESIPQSRKIYYDEMFDNNGMFTEKVEQIALDFMEIESIDRTPGNLKMNPEELSKLVNNYDELARSLTGTRHEWMLFDMN